MPNLTIPTALKTQIDTYFEDNPLGTIFADKLNDILDAINGMPDITMETNIDWFSSGVRRGVIITFNWVVETHVAFYVLEDGSNDLFLWVVGGNTSPLRIALHTLMESVLGKYFRLDYEGKFLQHENKTTIWKYCPKQSDW
jgi:hypothetical protein